MKKAPFVYWFQSQSALELLPEDFRHLVNKEFTSVPQSPGPVEKLKGLLITSYQVDSLRYNAELYNWREIAPKVFMGALIGLSPNDFFEQVTTGYIVQLADGMQWLIPVCNNQSENYSIPTTDHLSLDEDGKRTWSPETIDKYNELVLWISELHDGVIKSMMDETEFEFDYSNDHCMKMFCLALSINYNLGEHELSALGLFNDLTYIDIVSAMLDNEVIQKAFVKQMQEKTRKLLAGPEAIKTVDGKNNKIINRFKKWLNL